MRMTILRGLPGSGKTTYFRRHFNPEETVHCSSDNHMVNEDLEYEFDWKKLGHTHALCLHMCLHAIKRGHPEIVIDNVHHLEWHTMNYRLLAEIHGYECRVIHIRCDPVTAFQRNTKGVPSVVIDKYVNEWQPVPGEIITEAF